jgi:uncharacterized protein (DUF2147 family)
MIHSMTYYLSVILLVNFIEFDTSTYLKKLSQSQSENRIIGKWITEEKDVIEFYKNKNHFEGKIISIADKEALAKHPEIKGAIIFKKLEFIKGEYINGSYYDLESDESYKVAIKVVSPNVIKLKFGSGLFSETSVFKKIQ